MQIASSAASGSPRCRGGQLSLQQETRCGEPASPHLLPRRTGKLDSLRLKTAHQLWDDDWPKQQGEAASPSLRVLA